MVGPAGLVADAVVVSAEGCEVVDVCGSAFRPWGAVVEVAVGGGHATSWEDAGGVSGFDLAALTGGWSSAGETVVYRLS